MITFYLTEVTHYQTKVINHDKLFGKGKRSVKRGRIVSCPRKRASINAMKAKNKIAMSKKVFTREEYSKLELLTQKERGKEKRVTKGFIKKLEKAS